MNRDQEKAAKSLTRALHKVRDAELQLLIYSGSVYVCPVGVDPQQNGGSDAFEILDRHGVDCTPIQLIADGGAGV